MAELAGISTRTLRYYDQIGLLKPGEVRPSGYRVYGSAEVSRLQQIMFYRHLGMKLDEIKSILDEPAFDALSALQGHLKNLLVQREQINRLIANVEQSIASVEGGYEMSDKQKFDGFKQRLIEENEERYGKEVREKYGDAAVDRSNNALRNMTQEQYDEVTRLGSSVIETLHAALKTGDPGGELGQKAADLHRRWLSFFWDSYSKEAHRALAQMYVDDPRFTAYYDEKQPGSAAFLRDAVFLYTRQ